jgi:hypothetical protein
MMHTPYNPGDLVVTEHRASSIEHRASSIEHRASSIEHPRLDNGGIGA